MSRNKKATGKKVCITWMRCDKRRFDIDGPIKLLLDTIVKAKIIEDDSLINELIVRKVYVNLKSNQCAVTIY